MHNMPIGELKNLLHTIEYRANVLHTIQERTIAQRNAEEIYL
jgi:hypothetical protein